MIRPSPAFATAALLSIVLGSCVSYSRYEATALTMEKYRALARERRDTIEYMRWDHLETYRENERLRHEGELIHSELYSTRTQYAQLQVANADVVTRYDRSLALSTFENEGNLSARHRLSEAALQREGDAIRAERRTERLREHVETLQSDIEDLTDERAHLQSELQELGEERQRSESLPASRRETLRATPPHPSSGPVSPAIQDYKSRARPISRLIGLHELAPLEDYGTSLVTVTDEGHQYVVHVSESMTFERGNSIRLTSTGKAFVQEIAAVVSGRDRLELLVHPHSKREGTAAQIVAFERQQASVIVDVLAKAGVHPANVRALDDAQWAGHVTDVGGLGRGLDGEIVFVIRERIGDGMSMR